MPYVSLHTGATLPASLRQNIARDLGEIITVIPGKNVGNLMIAFQDGVDMVFAGSATDKCLYIDIKLHGAAEQEAKSKLVESTCAMLVKHTGIVAENIYITVQEFPYWGALGKYL